MNQRQEDYAQLLHQGVTQIKAYGEAGYAITAKELTEKVHKQEGSQDATKQEGSR